MLVQHLSPDHPSLLPELMRGFTHLEVREIEDGMRVEPNCVYVAPAGRDVALLNGRLQLSERPSGPGLHLPIDLFFRSLAQDQGERAIGVVLSGTGSDGAGGVRAIKGEGGLVLAQNPDSTEFDGMPRSAVATGAVDYQLPPAEMPAQLAAYVAHRGPRLPTPAPRPVDNTLKSIFVLLRAQTGHDFSQYKPSTVHRRIERRMAVHQVRSIAGYLKYLQQTPSEVEALFRDLLIGVTSFFRDVDAFEALERALPKLCASKAAGSPLRVWVAGCSTGEEAYSLAMLLEEAFDTSDRPQKVQIFATDIDSRAIARARSGIYTSSALAGVSPERLARFFIPEADGNYRVRKGLREQLIFSEHDLLKDPPFSNVDLLSCRNVLIYMGPPLQKKLVPLFHFALKPEGLLLLGSSESVGDFDTHFRVLDRQAKLYQRRPDQLGQVRSRPPALLASMPRRPPQKPPTVMKLSGRELIEQAILRQLAPASALVNAHGDIVYLLGRTGLFLEPAPGEAAASNILKMARAGLRTGLTAALGRAVSKREVVRSEGLRVKTNGHFAAIKVTVAPVTEGPGTEQLDTPLFLVLLEEAAEPSVERPALPGLGADARVAELKEELRLKDEYLQRTTEELETSTEELKSSNEEMQSVNEELQSTNEELETSKEELQAVNEELAAVNSELHGKISALSRANSDMNNLLAGTGIATVFLDRELRILRFTPAAREITNLIQSDVGRPVGHIVSNLVGYDRLVEDARAVLATLSSREVEVQSRAGRWYMLRIQPYLTTDEVVEGVVMSFLDITDRVRTREALHKVNDLLRLAVVVRDSRDAITVQDLEGRTLAWNPGAERLYGWSEGEALSMNVRDRIPREEQAPEAERAARLRAGEVIDAYETQRRCKSGALVRVSIVSTALIDARGGLYAVATTERALE